MLGRLRPAEITKVLRDGMIGRIGTHVAGRTYVVPVTYVYDGDSVYGHSTLGQKIRMMRRNPTVCFQVDDIDGMANWRSVIAQGTYEELHGDMATAAVKLIRARIGALTTSETAGPAGRSGRSHVSYRIRLHEKSGRYEGKRPRMRRKA
jgi:nitroimidazol reductase NimA-like FMN-containing flavoprotein (pyridoxamine 5'-phosphate oxidase superfamily)